MRCLAYGKVERQRDHKTNTAQTVGLQRLLDYVATVPANNPPRQRKYLMSECKTVQNTTAAAKLLHDCTADYKQEMTINEVSETVYALRDLAYYLSFLTEHLQNEVDRNAKTENVYLVEKKDGDVFEQLDNVKDILKQSCSSSQSLGENYHNALGFTAWMRD